MMPDRLSYENSCHVLEHEGLLKKGKSPPLRARSPRYDDEEPLGVSFFRMIVEYASLERLTLPRTFISRSKFNDVSFRETDLSESTANWNDFLSVDFSSADLSRADFRSCVFEFCRFRNAIFHSTDLRHGSFLSCDFTNADLAESKLTRRAAKIMELSDEQKQAIDWQVGDGPVPDGG